MGYFGTEGTGTAHKIVRGLNTLMSASKPPRVKLLSELGES